MREDQDQPDVETTSASGNWWEQPRPSYVPETVPWPPPLAPGDQYGPNPGQVIKAPGSQNDLFAPGTNVKPGTDIPLGGSKPPPPPPPPPPPAPGGGTLFQPFGETYTKPAPVDLGGPKGIEYIPQVPQLNLPGYTPPPAFAYDDFVMPGKDDVYQDPSYALRRDEGQRGIESSAAAQGRIRTGGTLNDILKYNQGFASSEYGNIVDRKFKQYETNRGNAVDTYNTNYRTQYVDPYTFDVQAAKDMFAPNFSQWQVQGQAGQRQNELNNDQSWQEFLQKYRMFDDQRKFKYGVLSDQERLGLDAATR